MRIDGFWASAYAASQHCPLAGIAASVGGWEQLRVQGVGALERAGASRRAVRAFREAAPIETGFRALFITEPDYPPMLAELDDAPPIVFVQGDVSVLQREAVAIVGTRRCTGYGEALARRLGRGCAEAGATVVSGMAFGIDRHAHEATFGSGPTVAVLGSGLGTTSPRAHAWLRRRIVEHGGAILSTWADDVGPARWTFPRRNRWIAALCRHTVVVEAPLKSGALHTATHALELGRDLWVVPGRLGDSNSEGCNALLAQAAHPLLSVEDFVAGLGGRVHHDWLAAVEQGKPLEQVAHDLGIGLRQLLEALHLHEARGELIRLPGNRYVRAGSTRCG